MDGVGAPLSPDVRTPVALAGRLTSIVDDTNASLGHEKEWALASIGQDDPDAFASSVSILFYRI
jgi:hypothetical protein